MKPAFRLFTSVSLVSASLAIALTLASSTAFAKPPSVQPKQSRQSTLVALRYVPRPPSRSAPGSSRGAASRACPLKLAQVSPTVDLNNLTALVPESSEKDMTQVWGQTSAAHPSFWFYVPYASGSIGKIEFALQTDGDSDVYRTPVAIPTTPGIVSVQLPTTVSLQPGKMYRWFFKVKGNESNCKSESQSTSAPSTDPSSKAELEPTSKPETILPQVHVEGWIERVNDPTFTSRLNQLSPQQQAGLYAENGYWYDALNALAVERLAKPNDATLTADWNSLLEAGGFGKIAAQPLLQCCSAK